VQRVLTLAILLVTVLLGGAVAAGIAVAAEGGFDVATLLEPSVSAGLLPPITIEGRNGWTCAAERSATAKTLPDAALPPAR
jgi:heme A synthase